MSCYRRVLNPMLYLETNLQYIYQNFLPTSRRYRVENLGKCWLKFDTLPITIKEMDKHVNQTFFSSDFLGHQIKAKQRM